MVKIIQAKMEGICGICGKPYKVGTRILKDPKTGKWVEADCYFPSHKRNANPEGSQAQSGAITKPNPAPPAFDEAEAYARNLLKKSNGEAVEEPDPLSVQIEQSDSYARELTMRARKIAQDETPGWEGMSEYPYLIATLIQTMHGRITNIEIAAQDEKKYKMWGKKV